MRYLFGIEAHPVPETDDLDSQPLIGPDLDDVGHPAWNAAADRVGPENADIWRRRAREIQTQLPLNALFPTPLDVLGV